MLEPQAADFFDVWAQLTPGILSFAKQKVTSADVLSLMTELDCGGQGETSTDEYAPPQCLYCKYTLHFYSIVNLCAEAYLLFLPTFVGMLACLLTKFCCGYNAKHFCETMEGFGFRSVEKCRCGNILPCENAVSNTKRYCTALILQIVCNVTHYIFPGMAVRWAQT